MIGKSVDTGLVNVLKMKCNVEFGRYIVAARDIDVGKTILLAQNFASVSIDDERKSCAKYKFHWLFNVYRFDVLPH